MMHTHKNTDGQAYGRMSLEPESMMAYGCFLL